MATADGRHLSGTNSRKRLNARDYESSYIPFCMRRGPLPISLRANHHGDNPRRGAGHHGRRGSAGYRHPRNTQIAFSRTATADGLGGEYSLTTEKEGFRRFLQEGITLVVNQNARIDVTLSVGQTSELVNVTAQLPDVDTHSSTTGEVVDHTRIHRRGRPGHAERVSPGSNHPHGPAAPDRTELPFAGRAAGVQDPHQRSSCRVWPAWLEACSSP